MQNAWPLLEHLAIIKSDWNKFHPTDHFSFFISNCGGKLQSLHLEGIEFTLKTWKILQDLVGNLNILKLNRCTTLVDYIQRNPDRTPIRPLLSSDSIQQFSMEGSSFPVQPTLNFPNLEYLNLNSCGLDDSFMERMTQNGPLKHLRILEISVNPKFNVHQKWVNPKINAQNFPQLEAADLRGIHVLKNELVKNILEIPSLKCLKTSAAALAGLRQKSENRHKIVVSPHE